MKHLLLAVATLLTATAARAADIDVVRQQFIGYATAASADRNTPRMSEAIGTLEWVARSHADALNSDGSWPDISYNETPDGNWGPWAHTQRLWVLAKAYQTPGQSLYRSPALLADINAALAHTKTFYGATIIPAGNWWFWTIGIPIDLGPTLVLMRGEVEPATFDDLVLAIHLRIGSSPTARGLVGPVPTGQNLVWSAYTHLCLGLLKNDEPMLAAVRDAMASVARPTSAEGIKRDRSFHQHGAQLYTGGYGGQFASDVARYALITRGTTYGLPSDALASFADYVADGIAWSLHGDYFDVSVISREVARPSTSGFNGMAALVQAAQIASPRAAEIRAAAAKILQTWRGTMNTELAGAAALVEAGKYAAAWPSGHRHYFASDYTIHRRPGWFASVKMFSMRTKWARRRTTRTSSDRASRMDVSISCCAATSTSDAMSGPRSTGRACLASPSSRRPTRRATSTATARARSPAAQATDGTASPRWSSRPLPSSTPSSLTAKKAWFFFDDAIVFLTNSIRSTSANRVETVVNQVSTTSTLTRRDDWAHLDNIGYWFPTPASLQTSRETRSGTWASLGGSSDTTVHTKPFVTMVLDHGITPVNATAEYVIVPNVTSTAMASWAASRPLSILANTDAVSAVRDTRNGNLGITFWRAASIEGIQSTAPAVVYLTRDANTMHVWAADPNANTTGSFTLTIPGNWHTTDVPSFRTVRSITLTLPRNSGQTTHVVLTHAPTKRRTVRR